jgi:hypothetical protein
MEREHQDESGEAAPLDPDDLVRRVQEAYDRLAPRLPQVDPGDLILILDSLFRPFGTGRRFLLKPLPGGGYVF